MAKKFWNREGFDIALFAAVFSGVYNLYYDSCDHGQAYDEMVSRGDELLQDKANAPLIRAFCEHRMDIVTSDREAAAFAVAYSIFENHSAKKC